METLDIVILISFFVITLGIGFYVSKRSGKNTEEYFLSGRNMPWWLLGISMVATTFSADTPNLVADLVRQNGVSGNWVWWVFLLTGMLTVFIYARLWRKAGFTTDIEFYELRYGGKTSEFLRGFRSIFLGFFFNVLIIANVLLAIIKLGEVLVGSEPYMIVGVAAIVTIIFSVFGGLRGVIYTDLLLFIISIIGSIAAAIYILNMPEVGGLDGLFSHELVKTRLNIIPDLNNPDIYVPLLIIPLAVQWWAAWYPGSEPGGGGYVAQRMLASKNEKHALGATFLFNVMHYAIRPWPWILVALASLIFFPDLASIQEAFPAISADKLGEDSAYPAMLTYLPTGLFGLVITSLVAAFMSTTSTHLNWGSSYLVMDFYKRFINQDASEKRQVFYGRILTVVIMLVGCALALLLTNAKQIFDIIIMFGAGTGLIFILRWFWWRINAWSEIVAMFSSGIISIIFNLEIFNMTSLYPAGWSQWGKFPLIVLCTTILWLIATYITPAEKNSTLKEFYKKVKPGGPGWKKIHKSDTFNKNNTSKYSISNGILATVLGTVFVYSILFSIGYVLYGDVLYSIVTIFISIVSGTALIYFWKRFKNVI